MWEFYCLNMRTSSIIFLDVYVYKLLKMHTDPLQGHDQTIVNNIGRIGYMTGGKTARWTDEELSFTFLAFH